MKFLRYWWRKLRGRCVLCGVRRPMYHPTDIYTLGQYCRRHNKDLHYAKLYGAGARKLKQMFGLERA